MKPTKKLHDLGQSLWLDNITRELLNSGTLKRYIDELSVTGLTSNPTIFDHAIRNSTSYDVDVGRKAASARSVEDLFIDRADGSYRAPSCSSRSARTDGVDGCVARNLAVLAHDTNAHRGSRPRSASARRESKPLHQDTRHVGRVAGHRSGDLRGRTGQRHIAFLARAICCGG
jgi:hypothetical protein